MVQNKGWIRPWRVAKRLDCSVNHIYDLVKMGELKAIRLGPRILTIAEESLQEFIERNKVMPSESI